MILNVQFHPERYLLVLAFCPVLHLPYRYMHSSNYMYMYFMKGKIFHAFISTNFSEEQKKYFSLLVWNTRPIVPFQNYCMGITCNVESLAARTSYVYL